MKVVLGLFMTAVLCAPGLSANAQDGDAEAGRKLATEHCARCHVVGDFNPRGGIDSTPSFQGLAKFDDYYQRFQTFYERRPHPVFVSVKGAEGVDPDASAIAEFEITVEQIDDLLAFIEVLRASE